MAVGGALFLLAFLQNNIKMEREAEGRLRQGGFKMAVEKVGEKYRCNICGNEVTVTKVGGGTLVCCGQDMEKINSEQTAWSTRDLPDADG